MNKENSLPNNWYIEITEDNLELLSHFRGIPLTEATIGSFMTSELLPNEKQGKYFTHFDGMDTYSLLTTEQFTRLVNKKPSLKDSGMTNSNYKTIAGTEVEELLTDQKKSVNVIEVRKQLLLSAEGEDKYSDLKNKLGWDDTDQSIHKEYRKIIEIESVQKENIDKSILTNESIWNYCVKNNYVLAQIKEYKGAIPEELLEAIENFRKSCTVYFDPNDLYVLCRFSDVRGNNEDIKKSKRYKKGDVLPKILLLERVTKGNALVNDYYKVIFEIGEKTPIRNFFASLFKSHTKTLNYLMNLSVVGGIATFLLILDLIFNFVQDKQNGVAVTFGFIPFIVNVSLIIMFLKLILPAFFDNRHDELSMNVFDDKSFKETSSEYSSMFNTSFLYKKRNLNIINKNFLRIRVLSGMMIIFLTYMSFITFLSNFNKFIALKEQPIVVTHNRFETKEKVTETYICTGFMTYEVREDVLDMSINAQAKRILEKMFKNKKSNKK